MNDETDRQAKRVNDDMALAAHDLLAGMEPARPTALDGIFLSAGYRIGPKTGIGFR